MAFAFMPEIVILGGELYMEGTVAEYLRYEAIWIHHILHTTKIKPARLLYFGAKIR